MWLILCHIASAVGYWIFFFTMAHVYLLYFTTASSLILIFFIKIKQTYQYLCKLCCHRSVRFALKPFAHFRRHFIASLSLLEDINQMYGTLFLGFIAMTFPLNAVMLNLALSEQTTPRHKLLNTFLITYQFNVMFIIHLFLTLCARYVHRHSKVMFSLMVRQKRRRRRLVEQRQTRLRLANLIFAFHTTNRYGFKYGPVGLISLDAFVKVCAIGNALGLGCIYCI